MKQKLASRITFSVLALFALSLPLSAQTGVAVVNAASFQPNFPVSGGSLASAFPVGGTFAGATTAGATELPLPTSLGGAMVMVDGAAAPLVFVAESQINFQAPSGLAPGRYPISIMVNGSAVATGNLDTFPANPGIFILDPADPLEPGAVLNQDNSINGPDNPAAQGSTIIIYGTGQGEVDNPVADGTASGSDPLSSVVGETKAFIAAQEATVSFSGLAPGFVGLWQVNAVLPDGVSGRTAVFVQVGGGLTSNAVSIWVAE